MLSEIPVKAKENEIKRYAPQIYMPLMNGVDTLSITQGDVAKAQEVTDSVKARQTALNSISRFQLTKADGVKAKGNKLSVNPNLFTNLKILQEWIVYALDQQLKMPPALSGLHVVNALDRQKKEYDAKF